MLNADPHFPVQVDHRLQKEVLLEVQEEPLEVILRERVEFFDPAEVHDIFFKHEERDFEQFAETAALDDFQGLEDFPEKCEEVFFAVDVVAFQDF